MMAQRLTVIEEKVDALESHAKSMVEWKKSVDENTEMQKEVAQVGRDLIAAMRVFSWVGKFMKWVATIVAGVIALIAAIKGISHL